MIVMLLSPLFPLKGRIASTLSRNKLTTITPLRACPDAIGRAGGE